GETSSAIAIRSSVVWPRADRTATTRRPRSRWATIRPAARLSRSASATDVPPNFITTVPGMAKKGTGRPPRPSSPAVLLSRSVRIFVLAQVPRLRGLVLRGSLQQERVVGSHERVGRRDRVGVVHGSVLAREGDEARCLPEAVLELGADLPPPVLEPPWRVLDHLHELGNLARAFRRQRQPEVEGKLRPVRRYVRKLPPHPLL